MYDRELRKRRELENVTFLLTVPTGYKDLSVSSSAEVMVIGRREGELGLIGL